MSDEYNPYEWDDIPDNAGLRHAFTGEVISYHEAWTREHDLPQQTRDRINQIRNAAAERDARRIVADHLLTIGIAAAFPDALPGGVAFQWTDLVDHVIARLEREK